MENVYATQIIMYLLWVLLIASLLACIPAIIASNKGYSFGLWWIYAFLLWIVALIHSICLKDKKLEEYRLKKENVKIENDIKEKIELSKPDLLIKYKKLLDEGAITQDEYEQEKKKILEM